MVQTPNCSRYRSLNGRLNRSLNGNLNSRLLEQTDRLAATKFLLKPLGRLPERKASAFPIEPFAVPKSVLHLLFCRQQMVPQLKLIEFI